ncbi:abscisic acid receptor PYR1 [Beta vulgaris subsp. vulgaris]|uniref:abscisic acid receptor PYR1 n=1 Tax=Beta vulgaris subsp. vulgaris TaxID=3555 RepID=UPI002036FAD4|nr:abscisic acid receptor PYR1 [Beta vulgaris subsp. vulgaris]
MAEKTAPSSMAEPTKETQLQNDDVESSNDDSETTTSHHLTPQPGLTHDEFASLIPSIAEFHTYRVKKGRQCSSLLAQKIHAPRAAVWSVVRRFDKPQTYKHFIKNCFVRDGFTLTVGCTREVNVISGLPAATSTERLDILDDTRCVTGFTIIGGEHRLRNYHSVTSLHALDQDTATIVLESYIVDVPEGNSEEDTRLFADTVVRLNLQKLASVAAAAGLARESASGGCAAMENR